MLLLSSHTVTSSSTWSVGSTTGFFHQVPADDEMMMVKTKELVTEERKQRE